MLFHPEGQDTGEQEIKGKHAGQQAQGMESVDQADDQQGGAQDEGGGYQLEPDLFVDQGFLVVVRKHEQADHPFFPF